MYLETLYLLESEGNIVRQIDIARRMGFSRPSVHVAVKKMQECGLVKIDQTGRLSLTDEGKLQGEAIYERHRFFTCFLTSIGVDEKIAQADACRLEHVISEESFEKFKAYCLSRFQCS